MERLFHRPRRRRFRFLLCSGLWRLLSWLLSSGLGFGTLSARLWVSLLAPVLNSLRQARAGCQLSVDGKKAYILLERVDVETNEGPAGDGVEERVVVRTGVSSACLNQRGVGASSLSTNCE